MKQRFTLYVMTVLLLVGCLTGCGNSRKTALVQEENTVEESIAVVEVPEPEPEPEIVPEPEPEPEPEPVFEEYDITLMAVGDNLMHMGIVYTGKMQDGTYDYSVLFEGISDFLDVADIKIINQETILGGNELGFSGYPYFNSPTEVGDAIAEAGFNVVLHASNHSADQQIGGLQSCATFWETYPEVLVTGIYAEEAEEREVPLLTIGDITFAVLNYTYGPNMEVLPSSIQGHLDMLCNWDESTGRIDFTAINPQVLTDIEEASEIADIVIVCPHWGTEYTTKPSGYQQKFAEQMTQAGADVIIGTHPHVVQPVEWIESENGNRALCYYSLGNYVSTQKEALCMLEAMAWVTFTVKEDGVVISEESTGVFPMVCHYNSPPTRLEKVYLLEQYTKEDAARHGIRNYGGVNLVFEDLQQWSDEVFGNWALNSNSVADLKKKKSYAEQCALDYVERPVKRTRAEAIEKIKDLAVEFPQLAEVVEKESEYPDGILTSVANNPEMTDFACGYLEADGSVTDGFTEKELQQAYPLFLQWDIRWGYYPYGITVMGDSGCGPTCLSMAIFYLTRNEEITPDVIGKYSMENGYYITDIGTSWALLDDYPALHGLNTAAILVDEDAMKDELDKGNILICSTRPGHFTAGGHFIVIYGYDENGFKVNDPKCVYRSNLNWSYDEISADIKQIWSIGK